MAERTPDWAIERALSRFPRPCFFSGEPWTIEIIRTRKVRFSEAVMFLAEQIDEHEEPPIDPLLIEARKLVARRYRGDQVEAICATIAGEDDDQDAVQNALIALRRGIELARSTPDALARTEGGVDG